MDDIEEKPGDLSVIEDGPIVANFPQPGLKSMYSTVF
jgi:hypothetical protein